MFWRNLSSALCFSLLIILTFFNNSLSVFTKPYLLASSTSLLEIEPPAAIFLLKAGTKSMAFTVSDLCINSKSCLALSLASLSEIFTFAKLLDTSPALDCSSASAIEVPKVLVLITLSSLSLTT